jgi:hypothetical protein
MGKIDAHVKAQKPREVSLIVSSLAHYKLTSPPSEILLHSLRTFWGRFWIADFGFRNADLNSEKNPLNLNMVIHAKGRIENLFSPSSSLLLLSLRIKS